MLSAIASHVFFRCLFCNFYHSTSYFLSSTISNNSLFQFYLLHTHTISTLVIYNPVMSSTTTHLLLIPSFHNISSFFLYLFLFHVYIIFNFPFLVLSSIFKDYQHKRQAILTLVCIGLSEQEKCHISDFVIKIIESLRYTTRPLDDAPSKQRIFLVPEVF